MATNHLEQQLEALKYLKSITKNNEVLELINKAISELEKELDIW